MNYDEAYSSVYPGSGKLIVPVVEPPHTCPMPIAAAQRHAVLPAGARYECDCGKQYVLHSSPYHSIQYSNSVDAHEVQWVHEQQQTTKFDMLNPATWWIAFAMALVVFVGIPVLSGSYIWWPLLLIPVQAAVAEYIRVRSYPDIVLRPVGNSHIVTNTTVQYDVLTAGPYAATLEPVHDTQ